MRYRAGRSKSQPALRGRPSWWGPGSNQSSPGRGDSSTRLVAAAAVARGQPISCPEKTARPSGPPTRPALRVSGPPAAAQFPHFVTSVLRGSRVFIRSGPLCAVSGPFCCPLGELKLLRSSRPRAEPRPRPERSEPSSYGSRPRPAQGAGRSHNPPLSVLGP